MNYNDAERYGILYYPTPYSSIPVETGIGTEKDLYFLGATKNRFTEIIEAYESCTQNGLKCDFNLVGVPGKQQVYKDDIHYIKSMPYRENLSGPPARNACWKSYRKTQKAILPGCGKLFYWEKDHDQQSDGPIQSVLRRKICLDIHRHKKTRYGFHPGQSRSQNRLSLYRSAIAPASARIHNRPLKRNCMII